MKRYFVKADQLYAQGLIDVQTLRAMVLLHGINIYFDYVVELDRAQNPELPTDTEKRLWNLVGRFPSGPPRF